MREGEVSWQRVGDQEQAEDAARAANEEEGEDVAADPEVEVRRCLHVLPAHIVEAHNRTHIPFRPWCKACVAARMANRPHYSVASSRPNNSVPEVHVDYCFFRDHKGAESVPTLVIKDRASRALAAHVVAQRGSGSEHTVAQACKDLRKWGKPRTPMRPGERPD